MSEEHAIAARPIVKWVGGKSWLVPELLKRLPKTFGRYHEPFAGGAALFFALGGRVSGQRPVLADANQTLMLTYERVSRDVDVIIAKLGTHKRMHSAHWYEFVRDKFNAPTRMDVAARCSPESDRAAEFIYLLRVCFNGLYRVNSAGEFNVPMGDYKKPLICPEKELRVAAPILASADLRCGDYQATTHDAKSGDVIYADPPYDTEDDGFTAFTANSFGIAQQRELASWACQMRDRGVFVMLSNADTPRVRKLYKGWRIARVYRSGSINSKVSARGKVAELLITPAKR